MRRKKILEKYYTSTPEPDAPAVSEEEVSGPTTWLGDRIEPLGLWMYVVVAVLAFVIYVNAMNGELFFDDEYAIERNPDVVRPDKVPVGDLFRHDYWGMEMADARSHKSYRPLVILTFRWNFLWDGTNPFGYHLGNVIFHVICSVLLLPICRLLLRGHAHGAFLATLVFAAHPVHCEAVSGVVGRAEVMCFTFFLMAFLFAVRSAQPLKTNWLWLAPSLVCMSASTLCKETGVTVLGCFGLYDLFYVANVLRVPMTSTPAGSRDPRDPTDGWLARFKAVVFRQIGYAAYAIPFLYWRLKMNKGVLPSWPEKDNPAAAGTDIVLKLLNYPYIYFYNAWLVIFPKDLCGDYTFESVPMIANARDPRNLLTLCFVLAALAIAAVALLSQPRHLPLLSALFFGAVPFLPSTNLFFIVGFLIAERVLYIPSVGYCIFLGYLYVMALRRWPERTKQLQLVAGAIVLAYAIRTVVRNQDWRTEEQFWNSALTVVPGNSKANFNVGNVFFAKGDYKSALAYFQVSLDILPDDPATIVNMATCYAKLSMFTEALQMYELGSRYATNLGQFYNWGAILEYQNRYEEAIKVFDMASKYNKEGGRLALYQDDHAMKALSAVHKGTLLCRLHRADEGLEAFYYAVNLDPNQAEGWLRIGLEQSSRGNLTHAIPALKRCLQLTPDQTLAWNELANIAMNQGDSAQAQAYFAESMKYNQQSPAAFAQMGKMYLNQNENEKAIEWYEKVREIDPNHGEACGALGVLYLRTGNRQLSRDRFEVAIEVDEYNPDPFFNFGVFFHHDQKINAALEMYERALALSPQHDAALSNMGAAYVDLQQYDLAISALKKALELRPENAGTAQNLALAYLRAGNKAKALTAYQKVVKLTPGNLDAQLSLGQLLLDEGRNLEAEEVFRTAQAISPAGDKRAKDGIKAAQKSGGNI